MKKLTAILMVLLCAFSLSADWGRIQYVDEFGDVDPTISDPFYVTEGTRYEYGVTDSDYYFRVITYIPDEFGAPPSASITIYKSNGDIVVFKDGGEAKIRVKTDSSEILDFICPFIGYSEDIFINGYLPMNASTEKLLNELYKGNDLKFVIYLDDARYNFTINGEGYKEVTDRFLEENNTTSSPSYKEDSFNKSVEYHILKCVENVDYMLNIRLSRSEYPLYGEDSPILYMYLKSKEAADAFWDDEEASSYNFNVVKLISNEGNVLSLEKGLIGRVFQLDFPKYVSEAIEFIKNNDGVILHIEFIPSLEFDIPIKSEAISDFYQFAY